MYLIKYIFATLLLIVVMQQSATAGGSKGSFAQSVKQGAFTFKISSRPVKVYSGYIVTVTMLRGGKLIARGKADVDYLPESAQAIDLNGDGIPELAIRSRISQKPITEILDVYWQDGTILRRSTVPEISDKNSRKAGGRFHFENGRIVCTIPLYSDGDPEGKPSGKSLSFIKYVFKGGEPQYIQEEKETRPSGNVAAKIRNVSVKQTPPKTKPPVLTDSLAITEIVATATGLEIRGNAALLKYKTSLLNNPERIVIDIADAASHLRGNKVSINKFGINKLRIVNNKGSLRIVMDTTNRTFDSYKLKSSGNTLFVHFLE